MGNRIYAIAYSDSPYLIKEIQGETFSIDEDGVLRIFNADRICILAFSSIVWIYIEDITQQMMKDA